MTDIANLALGVDSKGVRTGTLDLKKLSEASGQTEKQTDKTRKATDSLMDSMKGYATLAAVTATMWKVIGAHREFQKSISELSAITGATGADLAFYRQQALDLGASTTFAASEVATAFKLVASAKPDLLESKEALAAVTREVLTLAEASGLDLPTAANALGGALNQFGADASLASDYINVLAAGAKLGSSEVNQTAEALKNAGTVAASVGLSFEQTNAAIQALASVSIKGAEAGTGLRGVLLKLSTQNRDEFNPQIVGLSAALKNLRDAGLSTVQMAELFGQESITAASALVAQADSVDKLTTSLTGTNIAQEQAAINTNNLDGDIKAMSSSWEGAALILGNVFDPALRLITQSLTWLGKVAQTVGLKFGDLADMYGAYAAIASSVATLDFEAAGAVIDLRRESRAATEEKIANIWAETEAKKVSVEEDSKIEEARLAADLNREKIREKAIADAAARRQELADTEAAKEAEKQLKLDEQAFQDEERARLQLENKFIRMSEGYLTELEMIDIQEQEKLLILEDYFMQTQMAWEDMEAMKTAIEEEGAAKRAALAQAEFSSKMSMASKVLGDISTLMISKNKQMFEIGKKAAIAQAIIDTISAAQKSYNSLAGIPYVGPVLGAVAAGAAIVSGMARVNAIKSQSFSGGGGVSAAPAGGGVSVGGGQPPVTAPEQPARAQQDLTIRREGGGMWTDDMVESLLEKVGDYSRDNDIALGNVKFA